MPLTLFTSHYMKKKIWRKNINYYDLLYQRFSRYLCKQFRLTISSKSKWKTVEVNSLYLSNHVVKRYSVLYKAEMV